MSFLYSSIGILIFSGIFLITKHTLLFSVKDYYSNSYNSDYISSKAQQVDKYLLKIIENNKIDLNFNDQICYQLKSKLYNSGLKDKDKFNYFVFPKTKSNHPKIINSCILTDGQHRILIKKNPENYNKYLLNSCILSNISHCKFEENN